MFRDQYRKANESIHAPDHLLDSIKNEINLSSVPNQRRRINWPNILVYSGCAAAVAVLALLIFRPFSFLIPVQNAADLMEATAKDENYANSEQIQLFSAGAAEEMPMLSIPAAGESVESSSDNGVLTSERVDRTDGDEDEYYIFNAPLDSTYESIFDMLIPQDPTEESLKKDTRTEFALSDVTITGNQLNAFGSTFELPKERTVRALVEAWDHIYVISDDSGFVVTSVYNESGFLGETKQSGVYDSYEAKETTVFDDDYSLSEHRIIMVVSRFTPDLSHADIQVPETFVPVYTDSLTERALFSEEITCVSESDSYTVYGAVEASDKVKMLYIFAELG